MEALQPVLQHRAVNLLQHVHPHLDHVIGPHADDVRVERRVVQLAQRQAVRHQRLAFEMGVSDDVGRFEQFLMP